MRPSTGFVVPLFVIAIATTLVGCATPGPLVRLYPNAADVVWVAGRPSIMLQQEGVRVAAAFDHQDGGYLGLHVEVQNGTDGRLDVNPRDFTYTVCSAMRVDSCAPTQRVVDPEAVLVGLEQRQARETADAANAQAALATLTILTAVGEVAAATSGHGSHDSGTATIASASLMQSDAAARDSSLASIATQRQVWSNEALRRSTVFPLQGTAGRVYLPINLNAHVVWLHVRSGARVFSFPFRQDVTELAVSRSGPSGNGLNR